MRMTLQGNCCRRARSYALVRPRPSATSGGHQVDRRGGAELRDGNGRHVSLLESRAAVEQGKVSLLGLNAWMSSPSASTSQGGLSWPVLPAWRSVTSGSLASEGWAGQTVASKL